MNHISQQKVREYLQYNAETGEFHWKVSSNGRIKIGQVAGCLESSGYIKIRIEGKAYGAHRLAWIFTYGEIGNQLIDHINGDRADNRICNLRPASALENSRNRKDQKNQSGARGVYWNQPYGKWQASGFKNGRLISLGYFENKEQAIEVATDFRRKEYGEFCPKLEGV
ncbi:hypothetical protein C3432_22735 [Citrobacter amalonaticus]|uniref:HNH nuclease domain-containing protein n=1 Tax=Citrobacter amalonaticus TaxID=35703 RepID=A0A2S4S1H3_CITAM|nr:HNH endonuclease signature motif containing protein [Citrobacter amalonaticus]POT55119.1 hypothetical protein C3432_22735 [Citrobacter amalonaticus]POT77274.1 hypothetical protein C3436_07560 [Citrobacter amalonaticus]POU67725.1 hypothetical protein C3430_01095 [Citrobacter amalonaticus]POV07330.1 hypothetical protein C3424_01105 [Citrobacter amalonaticus]